MMRSPFFIRFNDLKNQSHWDEKLFSPRCKTFNTAEKSRNKTIICKNKTNIYINKTIICTNITFIYTFLRGVANFAVRSGSFPSV